MDSCNTAYMIFHDKHIFMNLFAAISSLVKKFLGVEWGPHRVGISFLS